ncbi:hypothetical protein LIU39_20565 [Streptomyces sp. SF28]|nr:hypothetical protein [Streptomyces pinistramenti]
MKTPISSSPNPPEPRWIGTAPNVKAIGSAIGAAIRSYGRTHRPAPTATSRKNTPYAVCAPSKRNWSSAANASRARVLSSPQPRPVSFGAGIRRRKATSGASGGLRRTPAR